MDDPTLNLAHLARAFSIPGLCVVVRKPEKSAVYCLGRDGEGGGRPVDERTWFQAASTGKHVTACAVLDLASKGKLDLERPIGAYLEDLPAPWRDRSILSLLRHTSGLPEYLAYTDGEEVPTTRDAFMARYADLKPFAAQNEAWSYSNTNYILLGFLIAQVSGTSYCVCVEALLARAGAEGAAVASPQWVREANALSLGPKARDSQSAAREVIGDGDIAFTADGALHWLGALLGDGVLDARACDTLFEPAMLNSGRVSPYACGWFVETMAGARIAHHAGHYDGWTALAFLNRTRRCGVLALCNLASGTTRPIRAVAQRALEDFAPGTTPLGLPLLADAAPEVTAMIRRQLVRQGDTLDRDCFAPELQATIDKAGTVRGMINLWTGEDLEGFDLVEDSPTSTGRMRRYRLSYAARTEHVCVGVTADGKIHWVWPL